MTRCSVFVLITLLVLCPPSSALTVGDLAPEVEWHTAAITITGNQDISQSQIRDQLVTNTRPWYTPWRARPVFDPSTFTTDIERIQRLYVAQGYYEATVTYDLEVNTQKSTVTPIITIHEGEPVYVTQLTLAVTDEPTMLDQLEALRPSLPLIEGKAFREDEYQQT